MPPESLRCRECKSTYPLDARYVCERCFGPLRGRLRAARDERRPGRAQAPHPGRARTRCGATATSCPVQPRPQGTLPAGWTPLIRADRLAERLGLERGLDQERRRQPDAFVQGPGRVGRAWPGRASSASRRSPARRPATSPTRSPPTRPRPAWSPTCSSPPTSRSRRSWPPASTGPTWSPCAATTTTSTASAPSCPANTTGRSSTSTCARTTPRAPRRSRSRPPSSSASSCPTASSRRSRRGRCSRRSRAASSEWIEVGLLDGDAADLQRRPGRRLLAGGHRVRRRPRLLPAGQARHDRQVAGDRQPGRRTLRARPGPQHRRRRSSRSPTTRSARASGCWPRRPASSPRPPAASPPRCWPSSPSAATSTPTSGWSPTSPARA